MDEGTQPTKEYLLERTPRRLKDACPGCSHWIQGPVPVPASNRVVAHYQCKSCDVEWSVLYRIAIVFQQGGWGV